MFPSRGGIVALSPEGGVCGHVSVNGVVTIRKKEQLWDIIPNRNSPNASSIEFTDDGYVLGGGDGAVTVCSNDGRVLSEIDSVHANAIHTIKVCGRFAISASYDGFVSLTDLEAQKVQWTFEIGTNALHIDNSTVLVSHDDGLTRLDLDGHMVEDYEFTDGCYGALSFREGEIVAIIDHQLSLVKANQRDVVSERECYVIAQIDADRFVVGCETGILELYDSSCRLLSEIHGHFDGIVSIGVSTVGAVASAARDGRFGIWKVVDNSLVPEDSVADKTWNGHLTCAAVSELGLAVGFQSGLIKVIDLADGIALATIQLDEVPVSMVSTSDHVFVALESKCYLYSYSGGKLDPVSHWNLEDVRNSAFSDRTTIVAIDRNDAAYLLIPGDEAEELEAFEFTLGCKSGPNGMVLVGEAADSHLYAGFYDTLPTTPASSMRTFRLPDDCLFSMVADCDFFGGPSANIFLRDNDFYVIHGIAGMYALFSPVEGKLIAVTRISRGEQHPVAYDSNTDRLFIGVGNEVHCWQLDEREAPQPIEDSAESLLFKRAGRIEWLFCYESKLVTISECGTISVHEFELRTRS